MKKTILNITLLLAAMSCWAQEIVRPSVKTATSFAIIIDKASYDNAREAVENYRRSIENDGLGTYIAIGEWKSPEDIRTLLKQWHADRRQPLEGCVLVGDIPIAMVRDAQYMTSAFKMNQNRDWKESSVPSDRFYDDFGLQFDFLKKDADRKDYFYYSLSPDSRHSIATDIYSARIRPPFRKGQDRYKLLRDYLNKVARIKAEEAGNNVLDNMTMARGHGYNSDDPNTWSNEQLALREQMPQLFRKGATAKFMIFDMVYPARRLYINEICRPELDVMLFHHHGAPGTQYLNGMPKSSNIGPCIDNVKRFLRSKIGSATRKGADRDSVVAAYARNYDVPESWCREAFDKELQLKDSIFNAEMDIHVEDLLGVKPNARFVLFDACYNGSFYEDDCIANAYIFNSGKTVATMGNTVNSIQDKWPDEFVGLMTSGMRVGQFNRFTCYLETHFIGDPTYHFKADSGIAFDLNKALTLNYADRKFWLKQINSPIADVQAMALRQLHLAGYEGIVTLLEEKYFNSDSFIVRLEAVKLLTAHYPEQCTKVLAAALDDNYELTRRMAVEHTENSGAPELLPALISGYMKRWQEGRFSFRAMEAIIAFDPAAVISEIERQSAGKPLYDDEFIKKLTQRAKRLIKETEETRKQMLDRSTKPTRRLSAVLKQRNYPDPRLVPDIISIVKDDTEEAGLRAAAANVLGWMTLWHNKAYIVSELQKLNVSEPTVAREIKRAINRLK